MGWSAVALSRDVPAGVTRGVLLSGRELVVWRGEGGTVQVWEDRCPHRGMRLSFGFVRGDTLNCLYHGWQYGAHGSCQRIPAHPDLQVPPTIRARVFGAHEAGGLIWASVDAEPGDVPVVADGLVPLASTVVWENAMAVSGWLPTGDVAVLPGSDGTIAVVVQALDERRTMLHALVTEGTDGETAFAQLRGFRDAIERVAA